MPKTDWQMDDTVKPEDLNELGQEINELKADGNVTTPRLASKAVTKAKLADDVTIDGADDTMIGDRTISDATGPASNTGKLTSLLSGLANMIKSITGGATWRTAPGMTIAAIKTILDAATNLATANTLIKRDANGRAKAAAPSAADDIARKAEVDAAISTAASDAAAKANAAQSAAISTAATDATGKANAVQANLTTHAADAVKHITAAERTAWNAKASTSVATTSANGLMSSTDKNKLDGIAAGANNYVHPSTHSPSIIAQDANNRFVTDSEKSTWNAKAGTVSPTFTGTPTAPTASVGTNNTQLATTAFVHALAYTLATAIPSGADLNTYTVEGNYYCSNNATATNISNTPENVAFHLRVDRHAGVVQTFTVYETVRARVYRRNNYSGTWGDWKQVAYTDSSITGNAATATKLQTARTITLSGGITGSTTFDGTGNVSIATTIAGNAPSATKLATARTINGVAFDGTANITIADSTKAPLTHVGSGGSAHADATTSAAGFMTAAMVAKLNGIATGANNYTHPTGAGNNHIPSGGAAGNYLKWSSSGVAAWSAIAAGDVTQSASARFVTDTEKSTWNAKASTAVATTSANGLMEAADKTKLNGIATGAQVNRSQATQAQAIAGTDSTTSMSPIRVREAIDARTRYGTTAGSATALTLMLSPAPAALHIGIQVTIKLHVATGANPTLNINGIGAKAMYATDGSSRFVGVAGRIYTFIYDGTNFILASGGGDPLSIKPVILWTQGSGTYSPPAQVTNALNALPTGQRFVININGWSEFAESFGFAHAFGIKNASGYQILSKGVSNQSGTEITSINESLTVTTSWIDGLYYSVQLIDKQLLD